MAKSKQEISQYCSTDSLEGFREMFAGQIKMNTSYINWSATLLGVVLFRGWGHGSFECG